MSLNKYENIGFKYYCLRKECIPENDENIIEYGKLMDNKCMKTKYGWYFMTKNKDDNYDCIFNSEFKYGNYFFVEDDYRLAKYYRDEFTNEEYENIMNKEITNIEQTIESNNKNELLEKEIESIVFDFNFNWYICGKDLDDEEEEEEEIEYEFYSDTDSASDSEY